MNRRAVLCAGAAALAGLALPQHVRAAAAGVTTTDLAERLMLVSGAGANVVALRGAEGLLLVDSGSVAGSRALQAQLRRFAGRLPVTKLINTHWHADQTGGNDVFGKGGAGIVAHAKARQRMAVPQYLPKEDRYLPARRKEALPSKVFYVGSEELAFDDETIEYGHLLEAHTDGDLYAWFRKANVLVVGDAAAPHGDPVLSWFEGGWLGGRVDALAKLLTIGDEQTRIVSSWGAPVTRAEIAIERDALAEVFTRMSESVRKGLTTEDMQRTRLLDGLPRSWSDPDRFIYDAHKGMWAHHNKLSHQVV